MARSRSRRTESRARKGAKGGKSAKVRKSARKKTAAARPKRAAAKRSAPRRSAVAPKRRPSAPAEAGGELTRLLDLLDRAWRGSAWHGPSVEEALKGVSPSHAAARPIPEAHTIGELVLHMATWKRAVRMRLDGQPYSPSDEENFPPFSAGDWAEALGALEREHEALREAFQRITTARLMQPAVPNGSLVYLQAHGVVHHDLWHAGQILVLRRAIEGRPAS
jgi:uncharacterized damage-inducible protein DinB